MAKKISLAVLWVVFIVFGPAISISQAAELSSLVIEQEDENLQLTVEFVDTRETRSQGLMNREILPEMTGMLFDFKDQKIVAMWMKNTLIPLDMIFANEKGIVKYIKHNSLPGDLNIVSTNESARYVLEVNAGFAKTHNVQIGNRLVFSQQNK